MPCAKFDSAVFDTGTFCDYITLTQPDTLSFTDKGQWVFTFESLTTSEGITTKLVCTPLDTVAFSDTPVVHITATMNDTVLFSDIPITHLDATVGDTLLFYGVPYFIANQFDTVTFSDVIVGRSASEIVLYSRITDTINLYSRLH
jgi:hypothetical protein